MGAIAASIRVHNSFGAAPDTVGIGEPKADFVPAWNDGSTNATAVDEGDWSFFAPRRGMAPRDADAGFAWWNVGSMSWGQFVVGGDGAADQVGRVQVCGFTPLAVQGRAWGTTAERKALYLDGIDADAQTPFLWVPMPLSEFTFSLGDENGVSEGPFGVDDSFIFADEITKVADHTITQNARALSSGIGHIARWFCTFEGCPIVGVRVTRDIEQSGGSSGDDPTNIQVLLKAGGS